MEEKKSGLWKNALNWGVILGVVSIIFSVLTYIFEFKPTTIVNGLITMGVGLLILIVILVMGMKAYRVNTLEGSMSYGQAFKFGLFVILIGTAISSFYSYIFLAFIDPEYLKMITEESLVNTEEFMLNRGMSEEQVDKIMEEAAKQPVPTPFMQSIKGFFFGSIFSTILNLIIAAIMKKKVEVPFED